MGAGGQEQEEGWGRQRDGLAAWVATPPSAHPRMCCRQALAAAALPHPNAKRPTAPALAWMRVAKALITSMRSSGGAARASYCTANWCSRAGGRRGREWWGRAADAAASRGASPATPAA